MAARRRRRRKIKWNPVFLYCCGDHSGSCPYRILGWRYGVADWISQLGKPVVQELDISGINSSHAVLMQARAAKSSARLEERRLSIRPP